jgi:Secretion system C-terminal sorting domain
VTVTAVNASGGGATPLFTFATNRGMTQILQAESPSNTFSLSPAAIPIGDNWIYVQMRTSETCYASPTNTDSIKINRSAITGVRDIDFPNQEIIIYPVPLNGQLNIKGLQSSKSYLLGIVTAQGQKIYEKKTYNSSSTTINIPESAKGIYWLTIYDNTRKRILGAIALIK